MKYLIVDISGRWAAGLDENGAVTRIPNRDYAVGDTAELPAMRHGTMRGTIRRAAIAAAAAVMVSAIGVGAAYAMPYGTVSLDASSSIEYTINCFNYVIGVTAVNEEGEILLNDIEGSLKNRSIGAAVEATVAQIDEAGYLDDGAEVLISVGTPAESRSENLSRRLGDAVENDMNRPACAVSITMDDVHEAHREHTTGGRRWERMQDETPDAAPVPPDDAGTSPDGTAGPGAQGAQTTPPPTPKGTSAQGAQTTPPPTPNGTSAQSTQTTPPPTPNGTSAQSTQTTPPPTPAGTSAQTAAPAASVPPADTGAPAADNTQTEPLQPAGDDAGTEPAQPDTGDRGGSSGG